MGPRVLVLGEAAVDVIVECGSAGIDWGQSEQIVDDARLVLGSSGAITAAAAAALGVDTTFVGVVGDDHLGEFFVSELQRLGVDTSPVVRAPGARTGMTVVLGRAGDRSLLTYPGTMADLSAADVAPERVASAAHLHISSYFLQTGLHRGLGALLDSASEQGVTTSLDPGWDPGGDWDHGLIDLLGHLDWFFPNEAEALAVAGRRARSSHEPRPNGPDHQGGDLDRGLGAALEVLAAAGCGVAVKLGPAGAALRHGGRTISVPTPSLVAVDTTGAGDNFDAGFIAALLSGAEPTDALSLGLACGRTAIGGVGGTGRLAGRSEAVALAADLFGHAPVPRPTKRTTPRPIAPEASS